MTDTVHDRVTDLLTDAQSALEEIREGGDDLEDTALPDLASDAADLLETEGSGELLEALGLGDRPDGSDPETIPEAIATGDPEDLVDLRAFVKLAKLAARDPDAEGAGSSLEELGDALEVRDGGDGEPDESGGGTAESQRDSGSDAGDAESEEAEADEEPEGDEEVEEGKEAEGVVDSVTDAVGDAVEGAADAGDDADVGDQLEAAVRSSFEGFDEDIRGVREQLEGLREEDSAADAEAARAEGDAEADAEGADAGAGGDARSAAEGDARTAAEAETEADDDGLLGGLGSSDSASKRGTMYSTMAPRPSDRADMRTRTRHSTMPDRN